MSDVISGSLALGGAILMLLAGVGVLRFPDLYSRMHAATKATAVGVVLISVAGAVAIDGARGQILLAAALLLITAPTAAHFIARAAYRAEGIEILLHGDGPDLAMDDFPDGQ